MDIDRTIEALNDWARRKVRYDDVTSIMPEMVKALAALVESRRSQRKKHRFSCFLKERDWGNTDFWFGAFLGVFLTWAIMLLGTVLLHIVG